ncbi:hypothetical protein KW798_00915 [Candidatus Parcubacteria bacterium]|nr:hypothetical protein [Candidatus Parcubacteria bacterium]
MIYFAVATLHFYRSDIKAVRGPQTPSEFRERNKDVVQRVFDEGLSLFKYELSYEQVDRAIVAYLAEGQKVAETKPATVV